MKLLLYIFAGISLIATGASAQDYRFEVSARGTIVAAPFFASEDERNRVRYFDAPGYSGEIIFYPTRALGVGVFCSRELAMADDTEMTTSVYSTDLGGIDRYPSYLMMGISGKLTSPRQRTFSVYLVARAFKMDVVDHYDGFSLGKSAPGYAVGVGLNIKLARWLAFNLFDASYMTLTKELSYTEDQTLTGIFVQSGLTFQLLKKK
jgi:hypothetical protein